MASELLAVLALRGLVKAWLVWLQPLQGAGSCLTLREEQQGRLTGKWLQMQMFAPGRVPLRGLSTAGAGLWPHGAAGCAWSAVLSHCCSCGVCWAGAQCVGLGAVGRIVPVCSMHGGHWEGLNHSCARRRAWERSVDMQGWE